MCFPPALYRADDLLTPLIPLGTVNTARAIVGGEYDEEETVWRFPSSLLDRTYSSYFSMILLLYLLLKENT